MADDDITLNEKAQSNILKASVALTASLQEIAESGSMLAAENQIIITRSLEMLDKLTTVHARLRANCSSR